MEASWPANSTPTVREAARSRLDRPARRAVPPGDSAERLLAGVGRGRAPLEQGDPGEHIAVLFGAERVPQFGRGVP